MSFLADFSKHIQPDDNREAEDGDYYGSPLDVIGLNYSETYGVEKKLLHIKSTPVSLGDIANLGYVSNSIYTLFKNKFSNIVLAETLLRVLPNTASSLNPNFFDGVDDYFDHRSNTHYAKDKIFSHLIFSCLAVVWQAFKYEGCHLPLESVFDQLLISVLNDNNPSLTKDSVDIYKTLYRYAFPDNLIVFLEQNLDKFLNRNGVLKPASCFTLHGLPADNLVRRKQKLFHNGTNTPYKLVFNTEPWSLFLHNYKQGNTINFINPSDHFPFYAKHPAPTLLWSTFLLIDLHEQLSSSMHEETKSLKTNPMNIVDTIGSINEGSNDLTVDANVENPKPCRTVHQKLRQQLVPRFSLSNLKSSELLWLSSDFIHDLVVEQASDDKACTITLRIPEKVFDNLVEPTVLINIHVFYYHNGLRSTLPCVLTEEYSQSIEGEENSCLQVELDWDYMNELALDPLKTPCLAGMSCENGKADIVVVFAN